MSEFSAPHLLSSAAQGRRPQVSTHDYSGSIIFFPHREIATDTVSDVHKNRHFSFLARLRKVVASWRGAWKAPVATGLDLSPHLQRDIGLIDFTASDFRDSWKEPGIFDPRRF